MRPTSLVRSAVRGALCIALSSGCAQSEKSAPPSVLLISIDTLRADHLGLYGYARDTSPFLDRLGAQGLVFERAFTSAAWTLIAHMTMLTGLYPVQHGVIEGHQALAEDAPLLAERLARAGYRTVGLYQPGWINERHGFARGFEVFRAHESVEEAGEHLYEELPRLAGDRPYFLFVHVFDVHNDPSTQEPPTVFSAPPPFQDLFLEGAVERLEGETYLSLKQKKDALLEDEKVAMIALYDDGIRHVDASLERWFARMEAEGLLANTLVIVTSDHGESLAQRGRLTGHGGPWQEALHVPLIVRLPGNARAGERIQEVAHLVDVVATVLDFTGLPADLDLPGHSLLAPLPAQRVVTGGNEPIEFAIRWPLKLTRFGKHFGAVDLQADPLELRPRPSTPEEFAALCRELELAPGTMHAPVSFGQMPEEDRKALEALGYGGGTDGE